MTTALVVSTLVLWIAVAVLAVVVFALVRQIGVLHQRIAPVGALMIGGGPKTGETVPALELEDLSGAALRDRRQSASGRSTLVFFLSPTCPICKSLLPALRAARRSGAAAGSTSCSRATGSFRRSGSSSPDTSSATSPYVVSAQLGPDLPGRRSSRTPS